MATFLLGPAKKSNPDVGLAAGQAGPGRGRSRARHAARRVVIVEDEAMIAGLIESILSAAGWSVVGPVATLERALEAIDRGRLDAALLDVRVNGHDAYAVADVLMGRGIPFIFVSGFTRKQMPSGYRNCAYIAKPFTPDAILARLEEVVGHGRR
jgi:DNA-binding response OmpR family regulator